MKKVLRKLITYSTLFLLIASIFNIVNMNAASTTINRIDMIVDLKEDGSALITQKWSVNASEGTELYMVQENLGAIEIKDFKVFDETSTEPYEFVDGGWNVNLSRSQKTRKNGFVKTSKGYELCWGIGDYGTREYTIQYTMTNFIKSFSDYDGFNQRLINDKMTPAPQVVSIVIQSDVVSFTAENTGIWSFGYTGSINFSDGKVIATTTKKITSSNYMNILMRFDKDIFSPTNKQSGTFESMRETAFKGSDYSSGGSNSSSSSSKSDISIARVIRTIFQIILGNIPIILFFVFMIFRQKSSNGNRGVFRKSMLKDIAYYREIPFENDLLTTAAGLGKYGATPNDGDIVGAYLLRWLRNGNIRIEESEVKRFIFSNIEATVHFINPPETNQQVETDLYKMLQDAAGKDSVLQENEFKKWVQKYYTRVSSWKTRYYDAGDLLLSDQGFLVEVTNKFLGFIPFTKKQLTIAGTAEVEKTLGLRKYLEDYSLISERKPNEVQMWDDYLVYAALFGIADKVAEDFKKLYPMEFQNYELHANMNVYYSLRLVNSIGHSYSSGIRAAQAARSSGGGGSSSSGGGGGFSGGGSGGGVR